MNFLFRKALEKGVKRLVQGGVAYLIALNLPRFGVQIDDAQMTVALLGLSEVARNWLKVKFGWKWL